MSEKTVTTKYNIILFLLFVVFQSIKQVMEYKEDSNMLIDSIFEHNPLTGSILLVLLFIVSAAVLVWVIRSFWDRFVARMFQLRSLTINESISIMLVFALLTVG